jgi:hypothetical protein
MVVGYGHSQIGADRKEVSAFLLAFRHSVIATGLVFQTEAVLREWNSPPADEERIDGIDA